MTMQTIISMNLNRDGRDHIEALRQAGYRVIEAASTEEAFRMAGHDGAALLLLQGDDERFRILADSAPALMWMNGPDGCEFVNRAYLDFLGVRDVDVRGFDWAQFVHPDDRKGYVTAYLEAVVARRLFEATFRFRRHDGRYRWMKSVGTPRFGPDGDFLGYVGSTIDVTDVHQDMEMNQPNAISPGRIRSTIFERLTTIPPILLTGGVLAMATLLRIALTPVFGSGYTFITFYPATMFSTVIAGWRYGLASTAATAVLTVLLFLDPFNNVEHAVALGVFLIVDGLLIVIADSTRQARHRSEIHAALGIAREEGLRDEIEARKRVEQALRESEERLQAILDRAPAAIFIKDAEGRSLFMNEYCAKVLGVGARAANGKTEHELFPRDLADQFRANDAKVWTSGKLSVAEEHIPSVEGLRTYLSQRFLLLDAQGAPYALCGIATDITERKHVENQLQDAHTLIETLLITAPIGFAFLDRQLRYLRINKVLADMNGLPIAAHIGRHVAEIVPALADTVREVTDRILATGEPVKDHEFTGETVAAPGVRRYWNESWYPVHEKTGAIIGFGVVAEEITGRKQAEQALRESELRFRALTERIGDVFWISDPSTKKLVYVSQAFADIWGRSLQDLYEHFDLWLEAIHEDDRARVATAFSSQIYAGIYDVEYRVVRSDGSMRWVRDRGRPLEIGSLVAGVAEDITDRKQAEESLREARGRLERWNVELEQVVTLKTTELVQSQERLRALATELNLSEQRERNRLATELHDHLQQMLVLGKLKLGQSKRLTQAIPGCAVLIKEADEILSDALRYTRTLVSDLSPTVLREHGLKAGLLWLCEYMQKHDMAVTVRVPEEEVTLADDQKILLFQSVRELLINSSKHAGTGQATLLLEQWDGKLQIEVRDEGIGFDLAAAAAAAAAAGSPDGGLSSKFGLFSIQERMRAIGGTLDLQSAPGQGTIARLTLPFGDAAADDTREATGLKSDLSVSEDSILPPQSSARKRDVRIRVLLVDDHTLIRQGLRAMLDSYPDMILVGEAVNGEEAVRLVEELHPAVVVMDINMPKMDGIEATRRITGRHSDIAVIGLSVNTGVENQEAMSRAGAVRLMAKESAMEELYSAIQEAVKR